MTQTNWNSDFNNVSIKPFSEDEVIALVNKTLSNGNSRHTTSYKYAFFKSILDNVFNVDTMLLTFDVIVARFTEIYWNLVVDFFKMTDYGCPDLRGNYYKLFRILDIKEHEKISLEELDRKYHFYNRENKGKPIFVRY